MKHPYSKKMTRHHPEVQSRKMMVDGFQDFAFKALHPKYEKSAAPLSKRRNGPGPVRKGDGVFFGNAPTLGAPPVMAANMLASTGVANRFATAGVLLTLGIAYSSSLSKSLKKGSDNTVNTLKGVSSLTAIRYVGTGLITYALISDFKQ